MDDTFLLADIYSNVMANSFVYTFALVTGFVFAGFISSCWSLITKKEVSFGLLYPAGHLLAVELFVVVFSVPLLLLKLALRGLARGRYRLFAWSAMMGAFFTGFFQGVAVLSLM